MSELSPVSGVKAEVGRRGRQGSFWPITTFRRLLWCITARGQQSCARATRRGAAPRF